ncbi:MAG TPA: hypothetical protein VNE16_14305 [Vicinamibacterales bacterium]|nr:hypothetical protein [Vicinamibacterales bacterium]
MSRFARICLIVGWLVSLVSVGVLAQAFHGRRDRIFSGDSLGFRIERRFNGVPTGRLMVRINGHWTDVQFAVQPMKGSAR